jgi:hypothetical protein
MQIAAAKGSALARVKPYPQASALRLCSPSLRFVPSAFRDALPCASLSGMGDPPCVRSRSGSRPRKLRLLNSHQSTRRRKVLFAYGDLCRVACDEI